LKGLLKMRKKLSIPYPIIVEGKYDRLRLLEICSANIITTDGFGIFKKSERLSLLRELSARTPIILLTDSDGAGKLIRSHITSAIPKEKLIQLYIPKIEGKEKRKQAPSAEGTLGVEGMEFSLLYDLLAPFENEKAHAAIEDNPLSKTDFYLDGLSGKENSSERRAVLAKKLNLPCDMTANALLAALKILISYEEYLELVNRNKEDI
jgi:ribonuclease M5